jgi:hypothetical protein
MQNTIPILSEHLDKQLKLRGEILAAMKISQSYSAEDLDLESYFNLISKLLREYNELTFPN